MPTRLGDEFRINSYITNEQNVPYVTGLTNGNFIVTWQSDGQDSSNYGIFGQLYDSAGNKIGVEFQINTFYSGYQMQSAIAPLPNGGFVVVWQSGTPDCCTAIFGQRFDGIGSKVGSEFQVNTYDDSIQSNAAVATLSNGDFIVVWQSYGQNGYNNGYEIYGQRFNSVGTKIGSEFHVNTYTSGDQFVPAITALSNNKFIVTWISAGQSSINAQLFDQSGNKLGNEFQVSTDALNTVAIPRDLPSVKELLNGNFIVVWTGKNQANTNTDIFAQLFSSNGVKIGSQFQVNDFASSDQSCPFVTALPTGNFAITWVSNLQDGSGKGVIVAVFNPSGTRIGNEELVNTYTSGDQAWPAIATLNNGNFVVVWSSWQDGSREGIYGQLLIGPVNAIPQIVNNRLTINEGQSVVITNAQLLATDTDNTASELTFTISNLQHGRFEFISNPGVAITSFTQQQINNGQIRIVHDGGEIPLSYAAVVSDGQATSNPSNATINFIPVNDAPILAVNSLTLNKGQTLVLSTTHLQATDSDNSSSQLIYTISAAQHIQFELVSAPGNAITSFTQQQINNGLVQVVHDGSNTAPAFNMTVSDGNLSTASTAANITYFNNAIPKIMNNSLTVTEGQSVILTTSNLSATDPDNTPSQLIFTVSNLQNGRFEFISAPGNPITSFTQQQVIDGQVRFVHGGAEVAPTYRITVTDGQATSALSTATINFTNVNDAPQLINNTLSISEGQSVILSSNNLSASDPDNTANELTYLLSNVEAVRFELVSAPGNAITSFTQQQINNGQIRVVHNDSEQAPSYSFTISDGLAVTASYNANIIYTQIPDAPQLINNRLIITEGQSIVLTSNELLAFDPDTNDNQIIFIVSNIQHGQFELVSNPGVPITQFSQAQVNSSQIRFVTDGNEQAPSYTVVVSDGVASTSSQTANITFTNINDAPVLINNSLSINSGQAIIITSAQLSAQDPDNNSTELRHIVSSVQHGQFEFVNAPGIAITSFTQDEINRRQVRFVQDSSNNEPYYEVTVTDGIAFTTPRPAIILFNNNIPPQITVNSLTIEEGQTVVLTTNNLNAVDNNDPASNLIYTVSNIRNGKFTQVSVPNSSIVTFTQQQLQAGEIQFIQNGEEDAPTYSIAVKNENRGLESIASPASVIFININDAPTLINPIPDQSVTVGDQLNIVVPGNTFNDPDGDELALYAKTQDDQPLPSWIQFDAVNRKFTGSPISPGNNRFSLFARDSSNAVARTDFNLEVNSQINADSVNTWIGIGGGLLGGVALLGGGLLALKRYLNKKTQGNQLSTNEGDIELNEQNNLSSTSTKQMLNNNKTSLV